VPDSNLQPGCKCSTKHSKEISELVNSNDEGCARDKTLHAYILSSSNKIRKVRYARRCCTIFAASQTGKLSTRAGADKQIGIHCRLRGNQAFRVTGERVTLPTSTASKVTCRGAVATDQREPLYGKASAMRTRAFGLVRHACQTFWKAYSERQFHGHRALIPPTHSAGAVLAS
jgi:hypothetical protein